MDNNISNIDEVFKNAFQNAEASHTQAEMHADWNSVLNNIPHVPTHTPAPQHAANQFAGGMGKIIGFSGLGAAVVTTAVILYNIYVSKPTQNVAQNKPATENHVIEKQNTPATNNNQVVVPQPSGNEKQSANSNTTKIISHQGFSNNNGSKNTANQIGNQPSSPVSGSSQKQLTPGKSPVNISSTTAPKPTEAIMLILSDSLLCINQIVGVSTNIQGNDNTIDWGDGNIEPITGAASHAYSKAAKYAIHVSGSSGEVYRIANIIEKPKARFSVRRQDQMACTFNNTSLQAVKYTWDFGDGSEIESGYYAVHTYRDTGKYLVRLKAYNAGGCVDSFLQYVNVKSFVSPQVSSNVITPNGDNKNDDVYVTVEDETNFTFTIVDHTGQVVFQTNDKNKHWGGKNQFTGSDCMPGAYFYSISYSFKQNGEPLTKNGTITLIR